MTWQVIEADCVEAMREMDEASADAVVTDPPYGLEFMGKEWDRFSDTSVGGNPNWRPQAKRIEWGEDSRGKGKHPSGYGPRKKNPRCFNCGGLKFGPKDRKSVCSCDTPYWNPRHAEAIAPFQAFSLAWATEALRVLKPGGHLLAFGGSRTFHRLACAVEDAGFEIRDSIMHLGGGGAAESSGLLGWVYGSGLSLPQIAQRQQGRTILSVPSGRI